MAPMPDEDPKSMYCRTAKFHKKTCIWICQFLKIKNKLTIIDSNRYHVLECWDLELDSYFFSIYVHVQMDIIILSSKTWYNIFFCQRSTFKSYYTGNTLFNTAVCSMKMGACMMGGCAHVSVFFGLLNEMVRKLL